MLKSMRDTFKVKPVFAATVPESIADVENYPPLSDMVCDFYIPPQEPETMSKSLDTMTAAELEAHITALHRDHNEEIKALRALLRVKIIREKKNAPVSATTEEVASNG